MDDALKDRVFGPSSFVKLKKINYRDGRMATFSELIDRVYFAFKNKDDDFGRNLMKCISIENGSLFGDTAIIYGPDFVSVVDRAEIGDFGLLIDENNCRKVSYGYKIGEQTSCELANNSLLVALVNGQERAEKVAEIASDFKLNPIFVPLSKKDVKSIEIRFPLFFLGNKKYPNSDRLYVHAYDDIYGSGYSLAKFD